LRYATLTPNDPPSNGYSTNNIYDCNSDPYATEPTGKEDWVTDLGAHLMMLIPNTEILKSISTDHLNGGPWIMWPDTPYAHIMIPIESR